MDTQERIKIFRTAEKVDELQPVCQELLQDAPALVAFLKDTLDGFASEPGRLADAEEKRLLACAFLMAGISASKESYPAILKIITAPEFAANVTREDWLSSEISRLLGIISPDDAVEGILAKLLDASTAQHISEQLLLTLSCRWIARRDTDAEFLETVKRIIAGIPKSAVQFEVAMAIVINAVAVGGDQLKTQIFAFYKEHEAVLSDRFAEKNLQSFFDLGKQRIKNMLTGNYMGGYGILPSELDRMVNYANLAEAEEEPTTLKKLPPIVRDRPKVGRNDPCPCGSGKKYKHCCGK